MKNIIHAFRQIAKVSKSIFLVMALVVATSAFIEIVDLFLLKYLIDYALSERFWFGGLVLFFECVFCSPYSFESVSALYFRKIYLSF